MINDIYARLAHSCSRHLALLAAVLAVGCTVGSAGRILVSGDYPGHAAVDVGGEVARAVGMVVARYGLEEYRETKEHNGQPCTMERACVWTPEGKPWLVPWVYVSLASDGYVHVDIEMRNSPNDEQVKKITLEIGDVLSERFGGDRVSINIGY